MRICYLCDEYPPSPHGGIGSFVQTIAKGLVRHGHDVIVLGFDNVNMKTEGQDEDVKIVRLPRNTILVLNIFLNRLMLFRELYKIRENSPIDIVEGSELSFAFLPKLYRSQYIIRLHGGHHFFSTELGKKPRLGRGLFEKLSFQNADCFCAVSEYVASRTKDLLRLSQQIEIIPNPVDTELFIPSNNIEDPNLIIFVGTVCEKKGIRQLVEAFPLVLRSYPSARLLVIGRDRFGVEIGMSFTEYLKKELDPKVFAQISYLGGVKHDQIPKLLSRAAICVYPSHMEAMPIAWLEGLAMGKAVIASQTGPGPEIIQDGKDGLLCNPYDPQSIADKIILLLSNPELRFQLGKSARKKTVEKYSKEVILQKNIDFYERCIKSGKSK